jgi:crossover junction endodeoxyribonuclease RuvC
MIRIIGIDPGLTKTGFGIIDVIKNSFIYVASGTIHTKPSDKLATRLFHLNQNLSQAIALYKPNESAVEETFININPLSSLKLGYARGAIILTLALYNLPVSEYSSTSIKKSVSGVGRADKQQVGRMIKILLPDAKFNSEDEADALAVAVCHNNNRLWK